MATNFPSSLDTSTQQPTISSTDEMDDSGKEHDVVHTNHSGAIIALETKLGTGDSNAVADAVLMGTGSGTSGWDTSPTFKGAVTVGVDDTGHDVKFFGATSGKYMEWDESADALIVSGTIQAANGAVGAPSITFSGDTDTGIYYTTEDNAGGTTVPVVAIATGGTVRATFGDDIADFKNAKITTTDIVDVNEIRADNGSASDPSFTFSDDGDTGWYRYAANSLGAAVGGNCIWYVTDAGNNVWKTHTNATNYNYMLGASHAILYMGGHSSTSMGGIYTTSSGYFYTRAGDAWRTRQSSGEFRPYYDSAMTLGSSAARWTQLYADTATISTSDVNLKTDIVDTTLGLDFIKALRPISYKWKKTDGGKDGVRDHQGFIAQEVETILDAQSGTDASKQAMWVDFGVTGVEDEVHDNDDPEKIIKRPAPTDQALRYEEFIAPIVKAIQELETRIASLEEDYGN